MCYRKMGRSYCSDATLTNITVQKAQIICSNTLPTTEIEGILLWKKPKAAAIYIHSITTTKHIKWMFVNLASEMSLSQTQIGGTFILDRVQ